MFFLYKIDVQINGIGEYQNKVTHRRSYITPVFSVKPMSLEDKRMGGCIAISYLLLAQLSMLELGMSV